MLKEVIFNSARCGNSNNPTFTLRSPLYVYAYRVKSVSIPFSFYMVNANNNTIAFRESADGVNRTATLPVGNYDAATILSALGTALTNAGTQAYTVTYDDVSGRLTISAPGNFRILSGNNGSTAWNVLGVDQYNDTASGVSSVKLPHYVDFSFNSSILLCSNALSSEDVIYSSDDSKAVVCNIPADAPAGSVIHYDNSNGGYLLFEESVQQVDFLLLDSATGKPMDLNGGAFTVILSVLTSADDMDYYR